MVIQIIRDLKFIVFIWYRLIKKYIVSYLFSMNYYDLNLFR